MSWDYKFAAAAYRQLHDLGPSARAEIIAYLDKRVRGAADPRQFDKPLRSSKHGLWRYRVRDWRILCRLEHQELIVVVVAVGHRSIVYDE